MLPVMRKIISSFLSIAAAAMTFVSCEKTSVSDEPKSEILTFSSEKPSFDDDRKTHWNGSTVQWSKGDKIRMAYTVDGVWQNEEGNSTDSKPAKFYASTGLGSDTETANFNVPGNFKTIVSGEHVFYALYPSAAVSTTELNDPSSVPVTLPSEQLLSDGTFSGESDFMVARSSKAYDSRPEEAIPLTWSRIVAHAHITLSSLKDAVEGEVVTSVSLTADEDAKMTGGYSVNLTTGEVAPRNSASNELMLQGAQLTVDASGSVSFWACFMPCTWKALTIVVETDKATYTREIDLTSNQKTFKKNARNLLEIGMGSADRVAKAVSTASYEKVVSDLGDWSGEYLIVNEENSIALDGSMTSDMYAKQNYKSVDIEDGKIACSAATQAISFTITATDGGWKICSAAGRYIGRSATSADINNSTSYNADNHLNTIEYSDGAVLIKGSSGNVLYYNSASTSDRFGYLSSVKSPVSLYRLVE